MMTKRPELPERPERPENVTETDERFSDENFLSRWSRRKREAAAETATATATEAQAETPPAVVDDAPPPGDDDMPPIETLRCDSDLQPFLSPRVSEELKRKAFRKIFMSSAFNLRDGLDDYDEDFTSFESLGDIIPAEYRRWMERCDKLRRQAEEGEQAEEAAAAPAVADESADSGDAPPETDASDAVEEEDK